MKKIILILTIATGLLAIEKSDEITKLSDGIKTLLSKEMREIDKSMQTIFHSIISGDYENITKEAIGIQKSFILKKNLTKKQKDELHTNVSKEFLTLDRSFHETAGDLANAAEFGDKELVNKYFFDMTSSCVKCHSSFATHRFSGFE